MCNCPGCDEMSCGLPDCDECEADQVACDCGVGNLIGMVGGDHEPSCAVRIAAAEAHDAAGEAWDLGRYGEGGTS